MAILERTGDLALSVDPGEIVSVLGAPGSGKTRLGLELAFLAAHSEGRVLFRGEDPLAHRSRLQPAKRPREITMLVQNAEDQLFARTVFDDVSFGPRHLFLGEEEIERRVAVALEAVGLDMDRVRDRSPFALSGGERRRVALAGVLAMEPEVLILDEPTANLDPRTRAQFLELLQPLRHKSAIVWLTARAAEAVPADRVYLLQDSHITPLPRGTDVLRDWRALVNAGIELPGVYELAGQLEWRGMRIPEADSAEGLCRGIVEAWRARA